jgi:Fe-S-cluster-containing dehydrogenase component
MPLSSPPAEPATNSIQTFPAVESAELRKLGLFKELKDSLFSHLKSGVRQAKIPEGETILELFATEQTFRYFFFITKGQVKAVGLDEEARLKALNFLRKGEFFVDKSFSWRSQVVTKMVALTDVELLIVSRDDLKSVAERHAPLAKKIRSLSERIDYRNRVYSEDSYARSVLEFLIAHELTQASRVKITQLDKCIECNTCYKSCEDRHGFQRLERGYARFGVLDFAKSCLTCFYPTCIPACPVDSVVYNPQKGEVEILDECIGCQACERACQYGAIKMYKVDERDERFSRFLKVGKKIKPKFVADKCNHCEGYDDMACISNCPTGAIIEVEASDLLENPRIFGTGQGQSRPLPSRIDRSVIEIFLQRVEVIVGLATMAYLSFEAYAMNRARGLSLLVSLQNAGFIPSSFNLRFERGSDFCNMLGNIGFTLIFIGMSYPLRKSFPRVFKYLGKQPLWLDVHNFCGLLGTFLVFLHTGLYFSIQKQTVPGVFGFLFLLIVTASGVFGRFLYAMIPRGVAGTELKVKDIEEEDASISAKLDAFFEGSSKNKDRVNKMIASLTQEASANMSVFGMIRAVIKSWWLLISFRMRMPKDIALTPRQSQAFLQLLHDHIRLKRNVAFLSFSSRLFMVWRWIHRPFAYVMMIFAIFHIVFYLFFKLKPF